MRSLSEICHGAAIYQNLSTCIANFLFLLILVSWKTTRWWATVSFAKSTCLVLNKGNELRLNYAARCEMSV